MVGGWTEAGVERVRERLVELVEPPRRRAVAAYDAGA
jgi:hypothetical protein